MKTIFKFLLISFFIPSTLLNCMNSKFTQEQFANEKSQFLIRHKGIDLPTFAHASTFNPNNLDNDYIKQIIDHTETGEKEHIIVLQKIYDSQKQQLLTKYIVEKINFLNDALIQSDEVKDYPNKMTSLKYLYELTKMCWITQNILVKSSKDLNAILCTIPELIAKLFNHIDFFYCNKDYKVMDVSRHHNLRYLLNYMPSLKGLNKKKINDLFAPIIESKKPKYCRDGIIMFKSELLKKLNIHDLK